LSLRRQLALLGLSRQGWYYVRKPESQENLILMNLIDKIYTKRPFYGYRKIQWELKTKEGKDVNLKRVYRLMREMGIAGIVPQKNLSAPGKEGWVMPYLLKKIRIERPNQVWAVDITYIRLLDGFCYLVAVMDWYSRFVLSWRLSNTLDGGFCMACLEKAVEIAQGVPNVLNSDQGSQFTSREWVETLTLMGTQVSHDGAGRAIHNVMIERVWRSLKYENVYLKGYSTMEQARRGIDEYFEFYNYDRPHQTLDNEIPATLYLK